MPLISWLTWIANHIGLGSVKNITGIRKDLVDTKKAKLEIDKLEDEAEKRDSIIVPATFEDVKNFDPKFNKINQKALVIVLESESDTNSQKLERVLRLLWLIAAQLSLFILVLSQLVRLFRRIISTFFQ
jgi:hypothetical protein